MKCKRCHKESGFILFGYCSACYREFRWWLEYELTLKVQNAETMSIFQPHKVWWRKGLGA